MFVEQLIQMARARRASDLHLEPGLPAAIRVDGQLSSVGEPIRGNVLRETAQQLLGADHWQEFLGRRSFDMSQVLAGSRCRFNIMQSARGIGMVIRLFPGVVPRLHDLNLHPDITRFAHHDHGLVIVSGSTGSGKTSTLVGLVQEINMTRGGHVLTIEQPIEYVLRPRRAFVRQREVGRDTPSFEQALTDAMREDPDVIVVGEMRTPEVMRLTLDASETGHLVFATMHAATPTEAINRLLSAFPPETQRSVQAQLADVLIGVVCQRLVYREPPATRIPECEVLVANTPVRAIIRSGETFKLTSAIETGRDDGMWTRERYRTWLDRKTEFATTECGSFSDTIDQESLPPRESSGVPPLAALRNPSPTRKAPLSVNAEANEVLELKGDEGSEIESLIHQLNTPTKG